MRAYLVDCGLTDRLVALWLPIETSLNKVVIKSKRDTSTEPLHHYERYAIRQREILVLMLLEVLPPFVE